MADLFSTFYVSKSTSFFGPVYHISATPDDTSTTRLYTIETSKHSKPHMTVIRHDLSGDLPHSDIQQPGRPSPLQFLANYARLPGSGYRGNDDVVGAATFHGLSSKIDITLQDNTSQVTQSIKMKRPDPLASSRKFTTTSLGQLKWKESGHILSSNLKLEDHSKRVIARYEKKSFRLSLESKAEFLVLNDPAYLEHNLDMIIVTGFATIEYDRRSDEGWTKAATEVFTGGL